MTKQFIQLTWWRLGGPVGYVGISFWCIIVCRCDSIVATNQDAVGDGRPHPPAGEWDKTYESFLFCKIVSEMTYNMCRVGR